MRIHVCWGKPAGPHNHDIPLRDIVDGRQGAAAPGISIDGANPRHEHEWKVWKDVKLPDGKVLIPGVIDSHHELHRAPRAGGRADRALRQRRRPRERHRRRRLRLRHVRRPRPGRPNIVWHKLRALVEGAGPGHARALVGVSPCLWSRGPPGPSRINAVADRLKRGTRTERRPRTRPPSPARRPRGWGRRRTSAD